MYEHNEQTRQHPDVVDKDYSLVLIFHIFLFYYYFDLRRCKSTNKSSIDQIFIIFLFYHTNMGIWNVHKGLNKRKTTPYSTNE